MLALGIGYLTAASRIASYSETGMPHYGPWKSVEWLAPETDISDLPGKLYLRAMRALDQGLPVDKSEILTFEAAVDSSGDALLRSCSYLIAGPATSAAWWSLHTPLSDTLTSAVLNPKRHGTLPGQPFEIHHSGDVTDDAEPFTLVFRLYRLDEEALTAISAATLPSIERKGCV